MTVITSDLETMACDESGIAQFNRIRPLSGQCLAHMRAARAQQPRDLWLIPAAIELQLHRVRRGAGEPNP